MKIKNFLLVMIILIIPLYGCNEKSVNTIEDRNTVHDTKIKANDTELQCTVGKESMVHDVALGGSAVTDWSTPYSPIYYGIPTFLRDIVGDEIVDEWLSQFESLENPDGRDKLEINVVNAVNEMKISKNDFIKYNIGWSYSKEEVEAMFSQDQKLVNKVFVNLGALLHNNEIYTANWLAVHTYEDYKREGITEEILAEYLERIGEAPLKEQHKKIKVNLNSK